MGLTRPKLAQVTTTTAAFNDPVVVLNNDPASGSNTRDIGIVFERGDDQNRVFLWDESADEFVLANSTEQGQTSGDVTLASYANLHLNNLIAEGTITMKGNVTLGDAATDTVSLTADVSSNIIPSADSTYSLGDSSNYWANSYIDYSYISDTLRIAETGTGLRMTNVGAFDNDGSTNFRVFATNDLILAANGDSGTALTIDATNQDVSIANDLRVSDADRQIVHGDTAYNTKQYVVWGTTSNATETEIFVGGTSSSRIPVASNTTVFYEVNIVARRTDATGESASWELKACVDNFSGTTADVGSVYEVIVATDDANWQVDARADDTNDSINIYVTGAAGKTIRWTAIVKTFEVAQ